MNIKIIGKNLQVGDSLKEYINNKLEKFEKFFQNEVKANVTLSHIKTKNVAEVTFYLKSGAILRAEEINDKMEIAIDTAFDKIQRQLRKHKTNIKKKFRKNESIRFDMLPDFDDVVDSDENDLKVVKTKAFSIKPMNVEEAILQMDMLNHDFYVFINDKSNITSVIYRRKDGKFGLIETNA